ncbi:acetyl-CoA acetyltransferase [Pseudomonas sp. St290]|nr:acetyl-CoA acetyltransferase [Pseudomonas sp. St290]
MPWGEIAAIRLWKKYRRVAPHSGAAVRAQWWLRACWQLIVHTSVAQLAPRENTRVPGGVKEVREAMRELLSLESDGVRPCNGSSVALLRRLNELDVKNYLTWNRHTRLWAN